MEIVRLVPEVQPETEYLVPLMVILPLTSADGKLLPETRVTAVPAVFTVPLKVVLVVWLAVFWAVNVGWPMTARAAWPVAKSAAQTTPEQRDTRAMYFSMRDSYGGGDPVPDYTSLQTAEAV